MRGVDMIKGHKKGRWLKPKVTPEMEREMRKMREAGYTVAYIASQFKVSSDTVRYHLDPKVRERAIQKALEWNANNPDRARASKKRFRKLHNARYANRIAKQRRMKDEEHSNSKS